MTLEDLKALPTLRSGPANDLKIDTGRTRVWVSRSEDVTAPITVKARLTATRWEVIGTFRRELSTLIRNKIRDEQDHARAEVAEGQQVRQ